MTSHLHIAGRKIGSGEPAYIIAEAGSNHDGSLDQALALVERAADAGVDAVKFQAIRYDQLWVPELESPEHQAFFRSVEFPEAWLPRLVRESESRGLHFLCSPTYLSAVALIDQAGAPAFKIASPQTVGDPQLLRAVAATGKPAIVSTGYADMPRIDAAVAVLRAAGCSEMALLHCVAEYPVEADRANLNAIATLTRRFGCPVGFSDHTLGIHMAPVAVALGACIIEKHFTTDRRRPGPDHSFALEPGELAEMVLRIREVEQALGDGRRDVNTPKDRAQIDTLSVRVVSRVDIAAGSPVTPDVVVYRRAPAGMTAAEFEALRSPAAARAIAAWTPISCAMLTVAP